MSLLDKVTSREAKKPVETFMYTEEQLMARLRFFIGICLALTLTGIVFVVLYSIIFVTQPLNAISPIDQKFFELIIPIATFLTGTLSGIMLAGNDKDLKAKALDAASAPPAPGRPSPTMGSPSMGLPRPAPMSPMGSMPSPFGNSMPPPSAFGGTPAQDEPDVPGFGGSMPPPPKRPMPPPPVG